MYYYPNAGAGFVPPHPQSSLYQGTPMGLKGRPVSSIEEARAAQIDFDGSLFVFPDLAHNRIYTKTISLDGMASLNVYELSQIPVAASKEDATADFITREEFDSAIKNLELTFTQHKEEKKNESNSSATSKQSVITF